MATPCYFDKEYYLMTFNKKLILRILIYTLGMVTLALGLTLNTKTDLGTSAIISASFAVSEVHHLNFANVTLIMYGLFVVVQMVLHLIRGKKKDCMLDIVQFALSIVFTRLLNLFSIVIPFLPELESPFWSGMGGRLLTVAVAVTFTGLGAAMSLNMRFVANPGDGIVQGISDFTGKKLGDIKNIVDISCVVFACIYSYIMTGHVIGVGIGTVCAMLGVGRVIAVFNHFFLSACENLVQ